MSLFIERYRPRSREEIVGNTEEIDRIFSAIATGNIPHMLFSGPPGVGKTTVALVIARQLFGEFFKPNFLELNASDERGINVVRETIKEFCKTAPMQAKFKILFLDEADNMTRDAQEALRRILEQYSQVTRFIFSCNDASQLIEPIQSRCELFNFGALQPEDILDRLIQISIQEKLLGVTPEIMKESVAKALSEISRQANGDMRKALNKLQVALSYGKELSPEMVKKASAEETGQKILTLLIAGRFLQTRNLVRGLLSMGYSERNILSLLHETLINDSTVQPAKKGEAVLSLAEADYRLTVGVSKGLQTDAVLLKLIKIFKEE
jgi:replication factor C small subunit